MLKVKCEGSCRFFVVYGSDRDVVKLYFCLKCVWCYFLIIDVLGLFGILWLGIVLVLYGDMLGVGNCGLFYCVLLIKV